MTTATLSPSGAALGTVPNSGSANGVAFTAGGGVDLKAGRNVSIRLIQAEYLMTRLPNGVNNYQNDLRPTFGVIFHFGKPRGH